MEEELCSKVGVKCGRWNPTAEQVKVLTELFSAGLRTPSTEQIQKISSRLSSYGMIESKNVFYWFQNHKARERNHHHRQKKRRRPPLPLHSPSRSDLPLLLDDQPSDHHKEFFASMIRRDGEGHEDPILKWEDDDQESADERREMKTLELFPLSTCNPSYHDIHINMGTAHHDHPNKGSRMIRSRNVDVDIVRDQMSFFRSVIHQPPLDLNLGFFM